MGNSLHIWRQTSIMVILAPIIPTAPVLFIFNDSIIKYECSRIIVIYFKYIFMLAGHSSKIRGDRSADYRISECDGVLTNRSVE